MSSWSPVWSFEIMAPSGIETSNDEIPDEYHLFQNYPNPFNPSTKINFAVPGNGFVNLTIYDVLGNEVTTLINEEKAAGSYEVDFNAEGLTSGIYFYTLSAGSFNETKKMVLLR